MKIFISTPETGLDALDLSNLKHRLEREGHQIFISPIIQARYETERLAKICSALLLYYTTYLSIPNTALYEMALFQRHEKPIVLWKGGVSEIPSFLVEDATHVCNSLEETVRALVASGKEDA